jgi:putative ABC transport system ATP-binding protein
MVDLMFGLVERHGATRVLVTHDADLARRCARTVRLRDGLLDLAEPVRGAAE